MNGLSVLFVNYNSWRLCVHAIETLLEAPPTRADGSAMPLEVVVVDNKSPQRDPALERRLRELCEQTGGELILHDENGGYSKGMNLALRHAKFDWLLVSNPDVQFKPGCIDRLLRSMERDESIGAAAPEGFWDEGMDGRLPPNILPTLRDLLALTLCAISPRVVRRYSTKRTRAAVRVWRAGCDVDLAMLSGCCFLMRRCFVDAIGFFDERFPLYYEDTDLSVRIKRANKRIVQVHGSRLVHLYNRSGQTDHGEAMRRYWASRRLYYRKWYGAIGGVIYDLTRLFLSWKWVQRRAQRMPYPFTDLGADHGKPVLELPAPCADFLVEISLDPRFYLAGGMFGSGQRWSPSDSLFKGFGPTIYWFRVVDLTRPGQPQIGVYRYELRYPPVFRTNPTAAPSSARAGTPAVAAGGADGAR